MKAFYYILFLCFVVNVSFAQDSTFSAKKYFDDKGILISEGFLRLGKPDGYWITYYPNGNKKTEGNRLNFLLDGKWKFYNEKEQLIQSITYKEGIKNGKEIIYYGNLNKKSELIYKDNQLVDSAYFYHENGLLNYFVPYVDSKKEGVIYYYTEDSIITKITTYKNNILQSSVNINKTDKVGRKQGIWHVYNKKYKLLTTAEYLNDQLHGYKKYYSEKGELEKIEKYENGILLKDVAELQKIELKRDYNENGEIESLGGYNNQNKKEGMHHFYGEDGNLAAAKIYNNGQLLSEGDLTGGRKNGEWIMYFPDGGIQAKGSYKNDIKVGKWIYYYENKNIQQIAYYDNFGKATDTWYWFFDDGDSLAIQEYLGGLGNGIYKQYNDSGKVVSKGMYLDGVEEGEWFYIFGDVISKGSFSRGDKTGIWTSKTLDDVLIFEGEYNLGLPVGKHKYWYKNKKPKKEGKYNGGEQHGIWKYYDELGFLILTINYKNGVETHYNDFKISPTNQYKPLFEY